MKKTGEDKIIAVCPHKTNNTLSLYIEYSVLIDRLCHPCVTHHVLPREDIPVSLSNSELILNP